MTDDPAAIASHVQLSLQGELNVGNVEENYRAVLAALDRAQELELELSCVNAIDSAGIQLLMLAKRAAEKQGKTLTLVGHSRCVLKVFELLELDSFFSDFHHARAQVAEEA